MMAIIFRLEHIVKLLLEKGAKVDERDSDGTTALWEASDDGYLEIVRLLLKYGADVDIKRTADGTTALWIASQNGLEEVVKALLVLQR